MANGSSSIGTWNLKCTGVDYMKWTAFVVMILMAGGTSYEILSYASMETEYEDMQLLVEAMWYKVPAMDVIEAQISLSEKTDALLYPAFYLRYPDGEQTKIANIPGEGRDCLGEVDSISVKFWIWCWDFGGWSVFLFTEDNVFERIGRTKLDYPVGEWAVIVVDRETDTVVAELPLYVAIYKPTGEPPKYVSGKLD
jgi:hypothetical protein